MPYFHRCDVCHDERQLSASDVFAADLDRSCEDCGEDGCIGCLPHGVCEGCSDARDAEDEESLAYDYEE